VADDAVLLREGLVRLLAEDGHQVVAAVGDGPPFVSGFDRPLLAAMRALARRTCQRTELGDLRPQRRCRCVGCEPLRADPSLVGAGKPAT